MKSVVVIGAGPAGLTAAYQLLRENANVKVIVLEQDAQVGGISKTVEYQGNRMDLGGHRFFSKSQQIRDIWDSLLPTQGAPITQELEHPQKETYPGSADPNTTDDVMLLRRRVSRIYYNKQFFDYPITVNLETLKKLGFQTSVKCAFGYLYSCVVKRKGDSLEDFYINRFGKPLYQLFFKDYTTKLWGVSPAELDSSWGAQRVKKLSLAKIICDFFAKSWNKNYKTKDTSLIEEFLYPKFGPGQLWETMAKKICEMGGEIRYNTTCSALLCDDDAVKQVEVLTPAGTAEQIPCDYVLSSMPVKELVEKLSSSVPAHIEQIAADLPYRDFVTVGVLVKRLALENATQFPTLQNIPPDCWIYVQDRSVKMGRIQLFNNWSPFLVRQPQSTVWLGLEYFCSEGDDFWTMSDDQIGQFATEELQKMQIISGDVVVDRVVLRQKKAYPAYFGTYEQFDSVKDHLMNYRNLICVGRNGQHRYNNMDHSMMTGIRAAQVISGTAPLQSVWDVNTEKEYHEEG